MLAFLCVTNMIGSLVTFAYENDVAACFLNMGALLMVKDGQVATSFRCLQTSEATTHHFYFSHVIDCS